MSTLGAMALTLYVVGGFFVGLAFSLWCHEHKRASTGEMGMTMLAGWLMCPLALFVLICAGLAELAGRLVEKAR